MPIRFVEVNEPPEDGTPKGTSTDQRPELSKYLGKKLWELPPEGGVRRVAVLMGQPASAERASALSTRGGLPPGVSEEAAKAAGRTDVGTAIGSLATTGLDVGKKVGEFQAGGDWSGDAATGMAASTILAMSPEVSIPAKLGLVAMSSGGYRFAEDLFESIAEGKLHPLETFEHSLFSGLGQGSLEALPYARYGINKLLSSGEAKRLTEMAGRSIRNEEFLSWAKANNIHIPKTQLQAGGRMSGAVETFAGWNPLSLVLSDKTAKKNYESAQNLVAGLRKLVGPEFAKLTDSDFGELFLGRFDAVKDKTYEGLQSEFNNLWASDPKMRVTITPNVTGSLKEAKREIQTLPGFERDYKDPMHKITALTESRLSRDEQETLEWLVQNGHITAEDARKIAYQQLTPPEAQRLRKLYRDKKIQASAASDKTTRNLYQALENTLDAAMKESFQRGDPQYRKQWTALNEKWAEWAKLLGESELKGIENLQRDKVAQWIASSGPIKHTLLQKVLSKWGHDPESIHAIQRSVMNTIVGDLDETGAINISGIKKHLVKMGQQTLDTVFGKTAEGRVALDNLYKLAEAEQRTAGSRLMDPTHSMRSHWIVSSILGTALGLTYFHSPKAVAAFAIQTALGAILFNPKASRLLTGAVENAPKNWALAVSNATRALQLIQSPQARDDAKKVQQLGRRIFATNDVKNIDGVNP